MPIRDVEIRELARISAGLQAEYSEDEQQWEGSPFAWIKRRPSRQIGTIGEKLVEEWLVGKGFEVTRSPDSEADRLVNGHRVEIKFSTLWQSGVYKFQQLRDQHYEVAICLGISPFEAHCWVLPKDEIMARWRRGAGIQSQHGGSDGTDTAWLSINVEAPEAWLQPFGGSLTSAAQVLTRYLHR
jgi:hypothetical protein